VLGYVLRRAKWSIQVLISIKINLRKQYVLKRKIFFLLEYWDKAPILTETGVQKEATTGEP
jgi:hypothetical protein